MLISRFPNNEAEARVMEMEKSYSIQLPKEYRAFLVKYNGGDTPKTKYKAGRKSSDLRGFYGFGSVRYSFDDFTGLGEWIIQKQFPIACDSFGNDISISLDDGKIYFVDHEHGFKGSVICDSFASFVRNCKSEPISEASKRSIQEREADLVARGRGHVITDGLRKRLPSYAAAAHPSFVATKGATA